MGSTRPGRLGGATVCTAVLSVLVLLPAAPAAAVTGDVAAPAIVDLTLAPRAVDVTAGAAEIAFRVRATDDLSGVDWVRVQPQSPSGQQTMPGLGALVSGTSGDGWWEGVATVRKASEPGRWQAWVSLGDRAGNVYTGWPERLADDGHDGHVDVTSRDPDLDAPAVVAVTVTPPAVDVTDGPATTTVDFRVVDGHTGAREVYLNLRGPDGLTPNADRSYPVLQSGNTNDGWWRSTVTVPRHAHGGRWTFVFTLLDEVTNRSDWHAAELFAPRR